MADKVPLRIENRLLASLPDDEHNRLLKYLEPIHFARKRILYEAGQSMRNAYFFRSGMASSFAVAEDGRTVQIAIVGSDGFVGVPIILMGTKTPNRIVTQTPVDAVKIDAQHLVAQLNRDGQLRQVLLRYSQVLQFAANNDLGVWKDDEKNVVCGYGVWRSNEPDSYDPRSVYPTLSELSLIAEELRLVTQKRNTAELILLLLDKIRRPIKLNNFADLITGLVVAKHSRIDEITYAQLFPTAHDKQTIPTGAVKTRLLLERLFAEIQKPGIEQRKSLLLNMKDSYGYSIEWFLFTRIATEAELAGLLEISYR